MSRRLLGLGLLALSACADLGSLPRPPSEAEYCRDLGEAPGDPDCHRIFHRDPQ
jgi:hypothetical protein